MPYADPNRRRAYQRDYQKLHREQVNSYQRAYRESHREQVRLSANAYNRAYYVANREKEKVRTSVYVKANRARVNAYQRAWRESNLEIQKQKVRIRRYVGSSANPQTKELAYLYDELRQMIRTLGKETTR